MLHNFGFQPQTATYNYDMNHLTGPLCKSLKRHLAAAVISVAALGAPAASLANALLHAAMNSVTSDELRHHVEVLADDVYEGRGSGTRGGHAAGQYLVRELTQLGLEPAGTNGSYFQSLDSVANGSGGRNILALLPGSDPQLAHELIVVGAHYDHVGRGKKGSSLGTIGEIHNGADDNASGVSIVMEAAEALATTGLRGRRSILIAFWDCEEVGLVGSKYWLAHPTLPVNDVKLAIHADMVGRLRDGRLQVLGTRSGYGLRKLMSGGTLDDSLWLDFSWELSANSDHWPFLEQEIPIVLFHTGLHDDYHRPSDDADRINADGMRDVSRYLVNALIKAANVDQLPAYREAGRAETVAMQRRTEGNARSRKLDIWPSDSEPPRLGISWRSSDAEPDAVILTRVVAGTPAADAGLKPLDRIYQVNESPITSEANFRETVLGLIGAGVPEISLSVESLGRVRTVVVRMAPLREDAAD